MKTILPVLVILFLASFCFAISVDQIAKLSKQKTSDDLLIELIQKEGLNQPVTSKDVVYLKEQGVSERVIQYLIQLSNPERHKMLPQQGKSEWITDNMRAYYTTKDGKKIRVVTNLDEQGKRLGGEAPPQPEPARERAPQYAYEYEPPINVFFVCFNYRIEFEREFLFTHVASLLIIIHGHDKWRSIGQKQ